MEVAAVGVVLSHGRGGRSVGRWGMLGANSTRGDGGARSGRVRVASGGNGVCHRRRKRRRGRWPALGSLSEGTRSGYQSRCSDSAEEVELVASCVAGAVGVAQRCERSYITVAVW